MIEHRRVAEGREGLRIHRIEAELSRLPLPGRRGFDPLGLVFASFPSAATIEFDRRFGAAGSPVAASSLRVACHVVSYPDLLFAVDTTFPSTGREVFASGLEQIARAEGRRPGDRPLQVLYTHAHFDHAGGRDAVEAMGGAVSTIAHPFTRDLYGLMSRRETLLQSRAHFLRDCEIDAEPGLISQVLRDRYAQMLQQAGLEAEGHPFGSTSEQPLWIDREVDPAKDTLSLHGGRIELLRFDGHIPGHLCVRVDRDHFISGDMWLPATTSTVTPGRIAELAGVPERCCGVLVYLESSQRLLGLDLDGCRSYPSHEHIFQNPKRMALRDLEILAERFELLYRVLDEHRRRPMRVLDLAWGGTRELPIWKLEASRYRLMMAHDEASAYVQDLVAMGDLEQVAPERYLFTGSRHLGDRMRAALAGARRDYGHLEFRSRARE